MVLTFHAVNGSVLAQTRNNARVETSRKNLSVQKNREIAVTQTFEPTFQIEPLFRRITGKENEVATFTFKVESRNRDAEIEVTPIGLRQELNGQIAFDESAGHAEAIQLISPSKMKVKADVASLIEGIVKIPRGTARSHSLGLLVRESGRGEPIPNKKNADGTPQTQAGILFVTQYLLRLDLIVDGARGDLAGKMEIEKADLVPFEGRPKLRATIWNPTDSAFEFSVKARLQRSPQDRSFKSLSLVIPARATIADDTRYTGRILPKSRLRLEELLPEAIGGGRYNVDLEVVVDEKTVARKALEIEVLSSDFPAQDVMIAQIGDGLELAPAQIELSLARGGNRRVTMLFKNTSQDTKVVSLHALSDSGLDLSSIMLQPKEFQLLPGSSRKISIMLHNDASGEKQNQYGKLNVESRTNNEDRKSDIPIAIVAQRPAPINIEHSSLLWDASSSTPRFSMLVKNNGSTHFPLHARLILQSDKQTMNIPGGFGKWLMPGNSSKLEFALDQPLPVGDYVVSCEIQSPGDAIRFKENFSVTDLNSASASIPGSPQVLQHNLILGLLCRVATK